MPVLAPLAAALLAASPEIAVPSRVDAVTVYPSSARVTRVARADVPAGEVRLLLPGFPDALDESTLRVEAAGSARARLRGVSAERISGSRPADEAARAAEDRLARLLDEDRALEDRIQAERSRREFAASLRSTYSEERSRNLAVRPASAREWAEMSGFVLREQEAASRAIRAAEAERRGLAGRVQAARTELAKLEAKRAEATRTVALDLDVASAGGIAVEVSYAVAPARWRPLWEARLSGLDGGRPAVELALHGSVEQSTGEDWTDVRLTLSTADAAGALRVPRLPPRWLGGPAPRRASAEAAPAKLAAAPRALPEERIDGEPAEVLEGALSASFEAPRRHSVDGAGRARTIYLATVNLPAEVDRVAVPRLDPAAYLVARAANASGLPLLPGPVAVHVGDEILGRSTLGYTPPGGELELAFGVDRRVRVERRVLERIHDTSGVFSKDDVWAYRTRIALKNLRGVPVSLRLEDLVPASREAEIRVRVLDGSTPATEPADPSRPGVEAWRISLAPQEERVVELRYEVRAPRGTAVAGLE